MKAQLKKVFVDDLSKQLGDQQFFTLSELKSMGYFGTMRGVYRALKSGKLTYVEISPRRRLVPRQALINFLRENLS